MNREGLKARGAIVSAPPTMQEVTWTPTDPVTGEPSEPVTFNVYVRAESAGWIDRMRLAAARAGDDRISLRSAIISHAIIFAAEDADGKPLRDAHGEVVLEGSFTYDEAETLKESLAEALWKAYERSKVKPTQAEKADEKKATFAKNSEPTPPSGTNSSEPASADAPLPKRASA